MRLGLFILRVVLGVLFVGHGTQKLFGWFGGYGPEGTGGYMESLGLRPGRRHAMAAGAAEAGGGALLTLGLATPVAAGAITGVMTTAIQTEHQGKGPWVSEGGFEYPLVVIAAMAVLADAGPGPLSLDEALGTELKGPFWAIVAIAAGVGASTVMLKQARGESATESAQESADESVTSGVA
jgi:putative oxidoreductase